MFGQNRTIDMFGRVDETLAHNVKRRLQSA